MAVVVADGLNGEYVWPEDGAPEIAARVGAGPLLASLSLDKVDHLCFSLDGRRIISGPSAKISMRSSCRCSATAARAGSIPTRSTQRCDVRERAGRVTP
jgi:hypothetical protein